MSKNYINFKHADHDIIFRLCLSKTTSGLEAVGHVCVIVHRFSTTSFIWAFRPQPPKTVVNLLKINRPILNSFTSVCGGWSLIARMRHLVDNPCAFYRIMKVNSRFCWGSLWLKGPLCIEHCTTRCYHAAKEILNMCYIGMISRVDRMADTRSLPETETLRFWEGKDLDKYHKSVI